MKKIKYVLMFMVALSLVSCDKFLNVTPIDNRSGNNYWETRDDVERYTTGLYTSLRSKIAQTNNQPFTVMADVRCGFIAGNVAGIADLVNNNIKTLYEGANAAWILNNTRWKEFYDIIMSANIMYESIDEVPVEQLSESEREAYKAEAVFLRNLCYFFMVRLYGDVPYYTDAYNDKPLPRVNQVTVMKQCIADLSKVKDNLPITYSDPSQVGIRAMRGAAIALLMHMNMWASAFEVGENQDGYYTAVTQLGNEIQGYSEYQLVPLTVESNRSLFKGGTSESLFELAADQNRGEVFIDRQSPSLLFSYYPYWGAPDKISSSLYYESKYMEILFPSGLPDLRRDLWFDNPNANNNTFNLKKFSNTYISNGTNFMKHEDNLIIFRLADCFLLTAEAYANLDDDNNARIFVNKVRERANASEIQSSENKLKDEIFLERQRELIAEGQYYYDLVRTKDQNSAPRVTRAEFAKTPISLSDYLAGGWTVPIDPSALNSNPLMTLNNFWR